MRELSLIVKSLWRNKLAPAMIIVQLAVSIAIISNALFFTINRIELIQRPTGVEQEGLFKLWARQSLNQGDIEQTVRQDIELLKSMPGVTHVTPADSVPLSTFGSNLYLTADPGSDTPSRGLTASVYGLDEAGLDTLGLTLTAGRNFDANEVKYFEFELPQTTVGIVSQAFAERLFPGESALGQAAYIGEVAVQIIGIVEQLVGTKAKDEAADVTIVLPLLQKSESINYLIRTTNGDVDGAMGRAAERLREANPKRVIGHEQTFARIKREAYSADYAMIYLLGAVMIVLIIVNALGIVGLTSLWVNQRKKQIGIRRALGATKGAIVRYFLIENTLLTVLAAILGAAFATSGAVYLAREYAAQIMPWPYIPVTAAALATVAFIAALTPALRASRTSPAAAVANG